MQGRLSPVINGKIQFFPKDFWDKEFAIASKIKINKMEWTLDYDGLHDNPLLTKLGQKKINDLKALYHIDIPSLTGDCFMQMPFWKEEERKLRIRLINDFVKICESCFQIGINIIVIPLVDNGSIENNIQKNNLISVLLSKLDFIKHLKLKIVFETDFNPKATYDFIREFPKESFGINYDTGNSASLDYESDEEFEYYGEWIKNVHIKDRIKFGKTVELGKGNANFEKIFRNLKICKYDGNLIMQTARDNNEQHSEALKRYKVMIENWIQEL